MKKRNPNRAWVWERVQRRNDLSHYTKFVEESSTRFHPTTPWDPTSSTWILLEGVATIEVSLQIAPTFESEFIHPTTSSKSRFQMIFRFLFQFQNWRNQFQKLNFRKLGKKTQRQGKIGGRQGGWWQWDALMMAKL